MEQLIPHFYETIADDGRACVAFDYCESQSQPRAALGIDVPAGGGLTWEQQ